LTDSATPLPPFLADFFGYFCPEIFLTFKAAKSVEFWCFGVSSKSHFINWPFHQQAFH
jgi:hypothetical protein